jgi:hypothetical protein
MIPRKRRQRSIHGGDLPSLLDLALAIGIVERVLDMAKKGLSSCEQRDGVLLAMPMKRSEERRH